MVYRVSLMALLGALAFASPAAAAPAPAGPLAAIQGLFAAAAIDDEAGFRQAVSPDFEAYDNGKIYPGLSLMTTIEGLHRAGVKIVWSVREPKVEPHGQVAFAHWINQGSVDLGKGQGPQAVVWLESADLERVGGAWRVKFLHSDRQSGP